TAWASSRSVLPGRDGDRTDFTQAVADDLADARPALTGDRGAVGAAGGVPVAGDLLVASTADANWDLRVAGVPLARSETYGWANQFTATRTGPATLRYDTPIARHLAVLGQAALWALVLVVRRSLRRRELASAAVPAAGPAPTGAVADEPAVDLAEAEEVG
ncbi:MAG: hypothetical protein KF703_19650, partial [Actinobacteria bacterium]|nr:hypothetical protein [Actinomycetota bacterium]